MYVMAKFHGEIGLCDINHSLNKFSDEDFTKILEALDENRYFSIIVSGSLRPERSWFNTAKLSQTKYELLAKRPAGFLQYSESDQE